MPMCTYRTLVYLSLFITFFQTENIKISYATFFLIKLYISVVNRNIINVSQIAHELYIYTYSYSLQIYKHKTHKNVVTFSQNVTKLRAFVTERIINLRKPSTHFTLIPKCVYIVFSSRFHQETSKTTMRNPLTVNSSSSRS